MPANLALVAAATPTPATVRVALETAVSKFLSAEEAAAKLARAATDAADDAVDALSAVERAKAAVAKAGVIDADALAEAVLAGKPAAAFASGREARVALTDAEEWLAQAKGIRDALARKSEEAKTNLALATSSARSAALAVVQTTSAANLAAFITKTAQLQMELQQRLAGLAWLRAERLVPHIDPMISRIVAFHMVNDPGVPRPLDPTSTAAKWEGMIATLTRDPKAPAVIP
jgi:hypothetical protein